MILYVLLMAVILVVGVQVFRIGVAADLKGRTQVGADAAALAGAGSTRDYLVSQLFLRGASIGPWSSYGGQGVGCPAATAYALKNNTSQLSSCRYDARRGRFSASARSRPEQRVGVANARAVATLNLPTCRSVRYADALGTQYLTRICTGNSRTASLTWKIETQTLITPPNVLAWRGLFRIRLTDEGTRGSVPTG